MKKRLTRAERKLEEYKALGIRFSDRNFNRIQMKERLQNCLWNTLLTFLFLVGISGTFLNAFDMPGVYPVVFGVEALVSAFLSFLYMNALTFNLGYVVLFLVISYLAFGMYQIINSGFGAILNLMIAKVDDLMLLPGLRIYKEYYTNRTVSVTACVCLFAVVTACFVNMWISRRKSIVTPLVFAVCFVETSIYLGDLKQPVYCGILILFFVLYALTRQGDPLPSKYKKEKAFGTKGQKLQLLERHLDRKGILLTTFLAGACLILFCGLWKAVSPAKYPMTANATKMKTDDVVYNVAWHGLTSLLFPNDATGGMNQGTFGDVNSIFFDGNDDLEITFVPYSGESVYLASYTAGTYSNEDRRWYNSAEQYAYMQTSDEAYETLQKGYEEKGSKAARATMYIKNIDLGNRATLYPYHVASADKLRFMMPEQQVEYTYYPNLYTDEELYKEGGTGLLGDSSNRNGTSVSGSIYTRVPEDLKRELLAICEKEGITGNTLEVIEGIKRYLGKTCEYSLSPGATPENEEFVLYFLQEKKKGFCVHFASAGCLMLQSLGIPARYVEGYCFDGSSYQDANLYDHQEEDSLTREEWYDGYHRLSFDQTITLGITDEGAHAWVEVYLDGFGWVPVEFTVGINRDGANAGGFLSRLTALGNQLNDGGEGALENIQNMVNSDVMQSVKGFFSSALSHFLQLLFLTLAGFLLAKKLWLNYRLYYVKGNRRILNQNRELIEMVRKELIRKDTDRRKEWEETVISNGTLKAYLTKDFGMPEDETEKLIGDMEICLYSGRKENNYKELTRQFHRYVNCWRKKQGMLQRCYLTLRYMTFSR